MEKEIKYIVWIDRGYGEWSRNDVFDESGLQEAITSTYGSGYIVTSGPKKLEIKAD